MNTELSRPIVVTADGSSSVYNPDVGQHYHSIFGARQESERVFIELGLAAAFERFAGPLRVFEMGFGTGLNALLTAHLAQQTQRAVSYTTVEAYPLPADVTRQLNFDRLIGSQLLQPLHDAPWETPVAISPYVTLLKRHGFLRDVAPPEPVHLVYYDAFAPEGQPELWTEETFRHVASFMRPGGLLTTYCAKGYVQRNLRAAGFTVEKHPGPARKREVLRAVAPA